MTRRERFVQQRKKMAMSQEELATALAVSPSTVARWEQGVTDPVIRHRRTLADLWALPLAEIDRLLAPSDVGDGGDVAPFLGHFAALEASAAEVRSYEPLYVPGLLQTREYAEAIESSYFRPVGFDEIERRVGIRMARQQALDELTLRCVIDESVLLRAVGTRRTMADQLQFLLDAMVRDNIDLRVFPLNSTMHGAAIGPFALLVAPGADSPYVACSEDHTSARYIDASSELSLYQTLFEHERHHSLDAEASWGLIERHRRTYDV